MDYISHPLVKENTIESKLYQELLAVSILEKGNTLVVMPTALGKTIVALLAAAEIIKAGKKVLFLAPTKPLAVQHKKSAEKFLNLKDEEIVLLTGAVTPKKRQGIIENGKIVCATPQSIQNDLVSGKTKLNDFGLVIFDEAHRAIGNYSYVFIAEQYVKQNPKGTVLALTASPGGEEEKIQSVCRNLFIKNVEIRTPTDEDVKQYTNEVKFDWMKVELPPKFMEIKVLLERFQKEQVDTIKKLGLGIGKKYFSRIDMLQLQTQIRKELLSNGNTKPYLYVAASRVAALLKVAHALTLLETQGADALFDYMQRMQSDSEKVASSKAVKMIMANEDIAKAYKLSNLLVSEGHIHPKLEKLTELLIKQFHENPNSKVIVFNHYRDNIRAMEKFLEKIEGIRPKRFVGQATKGDDKGLTQKEQIEIIQELKDGTHNCLLASSVAEEGLDIPEVDLVVFYEPVPSEIRMIQRRGRTGRKGKGRAIVLIAAATRDEAFYYASKAKEKKMHSTLKQLQNPKAIPEKKLGSQTTLSGYTEGSADKVIIYADTREQASGVVLRLKQMDAVINVKQLEVGDFILSDDVCVERKTVEDFLSSVFDGRLFNQLTMMVSNYTAPLIILEGNPEELYTTRNIHENAIKGILASIALNYRVPILYSRDEDDTTRFLYRIAVREQLGKENEIKLRMGKKGFTTREQQQFLMEGFPLVGPGLAKALLKKFGTVRAIVNATLGELQEVEKMGPKKAKKIHEVLNAFYPEKDKSK